MAIDISQFHQTFFDETEEHLSEMERLLVTLDAENPDREQLNAIFRAAHSIKGGAGMFGFPEMAALTHVLESLLDTLRSGCIELQTAMVDAFLETRDVLCTLLGHYRNGDTHAAQALAIDGICERLEQLGAGGAAADDEAFGLFEETAPQSAGADERYGLFEQPEPTAAAKTNQGAVSAGDNASIRVSVEKVDQLIDLVGELVITQAMLAQTATHMDPVLFEMLHKGLLQLERNTRDLQESVMSIRMLPIRFAFNRFPRLVRDLAGKLGKQVELVTSGENTELDKGLIEMIADPLTHLVRNSLDHGIESPARRRAAGKSPTGTITLSASHQGGNIAIEVADDGAGLDRRKILAKAAERGMSIADSLSDREVAALIFEPGFSTAETVTDISGRGVGMDVVKRNISQLGGAIEIDSRAGAGTRMTIRLPLTLAILDGMTVALGDEVYVIALNMIIETLQPRAEDVKSVTGQGQLVHVRGEYLPLIELHRLFAIAPRHANPAEGVLVLIEDQGKKAALFVDALVGQQQVVIKSLEGNYRKVRGVSGATIMGDGRVALILDVAALLQMTRQTIH